MPDKPKAGSRDFAAGRRPPEPADRPLTLRLYPDPLLKTNCEPVERFDSWLADVFEEMLALMRGHRGIGLAGPQSGLRMRLFVADLDGRTMRLANPVILARGRRDRGTEGCLSLPGLQREIERDLWISVRGHDAAGRRQEHLVEGLWARLVQHEIDHLNGILIRDHPEARDPRP